MENKSAPNTFTKNGVYYFVRRVPTELRRHYTSPKISYSLRTRSAAIASSRAIRASAKLDEYWFHLRSRDADLPGKHMLRLSVEPRTTPDDKARTPQTRCITLSEAVGLYLRLKGAGKPVTFHRAAERSCGYVLDICTDKPLTDYTKRDANSFRDALIARGMAGSSIVRIFGTVRSIFNFAASEEGITASNPFAQVYFDRTAGVRTREPISRDDIAKVQAECISMDDELRQMVALVADTGMRLAEAAGLLCEDFLQDDKGGLFVRIQPHPWRRLKTSSSARDVPLTGSALWAARSILENRGDTGFAFPQYNKGNTTNANSASAAANKWLKGKVGDKATMHGFRHSMRDRLRAVECPADIVDQIGGWQSEGVGQSYGKGYPLDVLWKWLRRCA